MEKNQQEKGTGGLGVRVELSEEASLGDDIWVEI